jgi:deoxyribodipyrimidine photo-lyase
MWFKRDLRVTDHAPLFEASRQGPCVCLYIYEPDICSADDYDASHLDFTNECLDDLDAHLAELGCHLTRRCGNAVKVLDELHHHHGIAQLWSHEETGNGLTFERDKRVAVWAKGERVPWVELPGNGVVRRLKSRDGWAASWRRTMTRPRIGLPESLEPAKNVPAGERLTAAELNLAPSRRTQVQRGGISQARKTLRSFLRERGEPYQRAMSSPGPAWEACSRLSPYLAYGCVSMREVYQFTRDRVDLLESMAARRPGSEGQWPVALRAFEKRLRWHCHFIQKLEDEPGIEFNNMNRAYDGMRDETVDEALFEAWASGNTGYPMVDACMRALHASGWINFRMRAMLVSFSSYHLWQHWVRPAHHLAKLFLDYEPGIHYSQFQMQSGVTGINAVRIYSPIKQVEDQDPQGLFIRRYCPELAHIPDQYLSQPQTMPTTVQHASGCVIGTHYPRPVVDHVTAYREAKARVYAVKRTGGARAESERVFRKHGSRKRPQTHARAFKRDAS